GGVVTWLRLAGTPPHPLAKLVIGPATSGRTRWPRPLPAQREEDSLSSLPDLIRQSMRTVGPGWTTGIGERSDAGLRTAMGGRGKAFGAFTPVNYRACAAAVRRSCRAASPKSARSAGAWRAA